MYGSKITSIREARGFTQEYMSKKLGIHQNAYCKIEKDAKVKVDDLILQKIADILGVSITDIKSATPIVMNFDNFQNNSNMQFGQSPIQTNNVNEKIMDQLIVQLQIKDKQIEEKDRQIFELLSKQKNK
jgi:transcriptional regulator with XRE-family HTH domain